MEIQSYNTELAYANMLFARPFSDIVLERQVKNPETKKLEPKQYQVNCVFGQRSRILKSLQNPEKEGTVKLPLIAINRTGVTRNPERLNNLHNEIKYQESSTRRNYNLYTPVPVDISYDVTVMSKFPGDIDKIMSNFIIFFNADIFVSCQHPKYSNIKFTNQIIMQDNISEEHQDELDPATEDIFMTTFQFIYKTYIFGGSDRVSLEDQIIPRISSYISTWIETKEEIVENPKYNPALPSSDENLPELTTIISTELSTELSTTVDVIYNGFVPKINGLNFGVYAVPEQEDFVKYINYVDEMKDYHDYDPYVDRMIWRINGASDADFPDNVEWLRANQIPELSANGF